MDDMLRSPFRCRCKRGCELRLCALYQKQFPYAPTLRRRQLLVPRKAAQSSSAAFHREEVTRDVIRHAARRAYRRKRDVLSGGGVFRQVKFEGLIQGIIEKKHRQDGLLRGGILVVCNRRDQLPDLRRRREGASREIEDVGARPSRPLESQLKGFSDRASRCAACRDPDSTALPHRSGIDLRGSDGTRTRKRLRINRRGRMQSLQQI